ncbi:hypothetical protein Q5O24_07225 [Eubacteriaceae bacterium ES3]|nr:hypothetical protein Q5O24_07225 [Eubacteriaceae bacterium ES3]
MQKKPVSCPQCGRRIFDSEKNVKTQTMVINPHKQNHRKDIWNPDYYIKCWKCQSIVGYRKINN